MSKFVISLDFELIWGVIDSKKYALYKTYVKKVPTIVEKLLLLFEKHNISATWATVGLMMCESKEEMLYRLPDLGGLFSDKRLDVRDYIRSNVRSKADDHLHYGLKLIEIIKNQPGQEIGSHSFSHFNCLENSSNAVYECFKQDLNAMKQLCCDRNISLRSYVFCRNQYNQEFVNLIANHGLMVYRGNSYNKDCGYTIFNKMERRFNAYSPLPIKHIDNVSRISTKDGRCICEHKENVFFMVHDNRLLQHIHEVAIVNQMESAFQKKQDFHLWFHPWNLGRNVNMGIDSLNLIFEKFNAVKSRYGAISCSMGDMARHQ